jgi:hypothetical protein
MSQNAGITDKMVSKRARQREMLVLAMLQEPTQEKAARSIGISSVTAWRIMQTPEFMAEYRQARGDAVLQAHARLQHSSNVAVTTLLETMVDPKASHAIRLRAAEAVLDRACKSLEMEDLAERVCQLEERAAAKDREPQG